MSRHLILVAAASAVIAHLPGQAVWFGRATDTIRLTHNTVLGAAATIEAVVYFDGATSLGALFNEWTDNAEDKLLRVGPSLLEGYGLLAQGSVLFNGPIATDRWHHVAYEFDGSEQRLYPNGQVVARRPGSGGFSNAIGLGHLGDSPHPGHSSFRGYLESLRISSTARYMGTSFTPPTRDMSSDASTCVLYNFNEPAGSPTVADSSSCGNHGTLGVGITGATSPTLGINVMTCQRTGGGMLGAPGNQRPVDEANGTISVTPGAQIIGNVRLLTYNDMNSNAVAPLGGTAVWGSRTSQHWTINGWIATGLNTYDASVNVTAPTQPGVYYLIFGFGGKFGVDQVMSGTHPAIAAVWFDGNDVGFDWTAQQLETALANGGAVTVNERLPNGSFALALLPFTAVRVNVGTPASVSPLGPGCPGSRGVPRLQATLPRIGTTVLLTCENLVPWQLAAIFFGASSTQWNRVPLPLDLSSIGMSPGCFLRCSIDDVVAGPNFAGVFFAGLWIGNDSSLLGAQIHTQAIGFEPGVNPFGAVLSNALTLTIGI